MLPGKKVIEERSSVSEYLAQNGNSSQKKIEKIKPQNSDKIAHLGIFVHKNDPTPNIFYYYAQKYDGDLRQHMEDYILKVLHDFLRSTQKSFSIAYIHSSFVDFIIFRKILQKWPQQFFKRVRRIYIVGVSIMVKFIEAMSFGTFYRLLDELLVNLERPEDIQPIDNQILVSLGERKAPPPKNTNNMQNANNVAYKPPPIKIIKNEIYGKVLNQYKLENGKYPVLILLLLKKLLANQELLKLQGIFRKSCNSQQLQILQHNIIKQNYEYLWNQKDVLVVCGCLKKIFNNLELPLFSYEIYKQIISFQTTGQSSEIQFVKIMVKSMPKENRSTMILMITFLLDHIVKYEADNKMSSYNIAVVFGPCFFRPKEYDLQDLMKSGKFSRVVLLLLTKYGEIIQPQIALQTRNKLAQLKFPKFNSDP